MSADIIISFHPTLAGNSSTSWPASLKVAHEAGFAAMDMELPQLAAEPVATIRERLLEVGIMAGPASLPVEFRTDEPRFQGDLQHLSELAAHAAAIGVKTMFRSIPASSSVPAAELRQTLRRRISDCANVLADYGIDFAIEAIGPLHRRREHPYEFIWRLPDAADFAASCDGDVGLLVDSWHWHHSRATPAQLTALGPLIRHVHVADAADIPEQDVRDEHRLLPGQGIIDHAGFIDALYKAGYKGFVSPEIRGYQCRARPVACARRAHIAVLATLGLSRPPSASP